MGFAVTDLSFSAAVTAVERFQVGDVGIGQVGDEHLEPVPVDVGERQLGAGVWIFMSAHESGVEIDHIEPWIRAGSPRPFPGISPSRLDPGQRGVVDRVQGAPHRCMRRHSTEQVRLITEHGDIGDRLAAVGESHGQIDEYLATVRATATLFGRCHRRRQRCGQPERVGQISEQTGPA